MAESICSKCEFVKEDMTSDWGIIYICIYGKKLKLDYITGGKHYSGYRSCWWNNRKGNCKDFIIKTEGD